MYWWWGIAFGLMDESVPHPEMEDYHPDTSTVTISNPDFLEETKMDILSQYFI